MDPNEITDIDARISFRSISQTGSLLTYEKANTLLLLLSGELQFLKKFREYKVGEALDILNESSHIFDNDEKFGLLNLSYRNKILHLIAEKYLKKSIVYHIGKGGSLQVALYEGTKKKNICKVKIPLHQKSNEVLKSTTDSLETILKYELKDKWDKLMKEPMSKKLVRRGDIKSWPIVKERIYILYTILLPIYPSRAHMYGLKKWEGQKAKYSDSLTKDIVQILKERFPNDLKNLTEGVIESCIQYRKGKKKRI